MTRANKEKLLQSFDLLNDIRDPWRSKNHHIGKGGGGFQCGDCGKLEASSDPHSDSCAVHKAIQAISARIPFFNEREKWLSESTNEEASA